GWVAGGPETYERLIREIAVGAQAAVVFVDFTPAPNARYPVQLEQAYAVLHEIVRNGEDLCLDVSRIAVAGDSSGGAMATGIAMLAKRRRGPQLAFQLLLY